MNTRTQLPVRLVPILAALLLAMVLGCTPAAQPPARESAAPGEKSAAGKPKEGQPRYGGVLMLLSNAAGDPPSLDTHIESTTATTQVTHPSYDNLIRFDWFEEDKIVSDLAEKWEVSADGKTYTFHLRKGVKFHNGNPFTSADVKFTLDKVMNPPKGMPSPRQGQFTAVSSIETPDDFTVVFKTSRPNPSLLAALAQGVMPIYDKEYADQKGIEIYQKEVMGTGPFKFKKYIRGTSVESERNPDYWEKGKPYLDGVKTLIVTDANTRLAAFRTGQVHMYSPTGAQVDQLKKEMGDKADFYTKAGLGFSATVLNTKRKPYDNPKVREALNLAVSRDDAIAVLRQGEGIKGGFLVTNGFWGQPLSELEKLPGYGKDKTKDRERANALMAEAGLAGGFKETIVTRQSTSYIDAAVFVVDQLKKIGINAEVKSYESATAYDLAYKGDFGIISWFFGPGLDDPDALLSEFILCDSVRNWAHLCDPEVETLFLKQSQEMDIEKRRALVHELEKKALLNNAFIMSYANISTSAQFKFIKGYIPHVSARNNSRFVEMWFDK